MTTKDLDSIYNEFLARHKEEKIPIKSDELLKIIIKAEKDAKENYKKLTKPKTCPEKLYIKIFVRAVVVYDWAKKSVKTVNPNNPPPYLKASIGFINNYPPILLEKLRDVLINTKPEEREKIWNVFDLPTKEIEKNFIDIIKERNLFAQTKGFDNRIYSALSWYKIPQRYLIRFLSNFDNLIDYCNEQLSNYLDQPEWIYSKYNLHPCFMCRLPSFPLRTKDEVFDFVGKNHKEISKYRNKILIITGKYSKMEYLYNKDNFKIAINEKANTRHVITDLIHELSHVIYCLQQFKKGINPQKEGTFKGEYGATKIEYNLLKKLSSELYRVKFGDALSSFFRVFFEIELYKNPNQSPSKLYASVYNRCYKKANQQTNPSFLLDEYIMNSPFYTLPHAIAHSELILNLMKNK